jgi:hypothetical protein
MRVDRWFGSGSDDATYQHVFGSVSLAQLWDDHYGFRFPLRFSANLPLPQLDQRLHAFIGRLDPNEFITESDEPSGAFRRQVGPASDDQTLMGLDFHEKPKEGGSFAAGAGVHISIPLNPYVKGSYVYSVGDAKLALLTLRQTTFWEHDQGFGVTSRADIDDVQLQRSLVRWSASATLSEKTRGVAAWSAILLMHSISDSQALAAEIEVDGETDAPVPLHSYGVQLAYRQTVLRPWLIVEWRTSLAWPRDDPAMRRKADPGLGIGLEMLFGTKKFLARPVTF